jgi:hypothetical protein
MLLWFEVVLATSGALIKMCGVPMDATFHGGSNDTIGGRVRHRRPDILPIFSNPWQLPTSMAPLFLSPAIKFIADAVVTGDH